MKHSLLVWLLAGLLAAGAAAGAADARPWRGNLDPIDAADWTTDRAAHLLERAGFGGTPEDIEKLAAMTPQAAVEFLVDYESIDVSHLPPFDESPIYPNGYKYEHITKTAPKARATGRAYGIDATQEGKLPLQPGVTEYYTLMWSDRLEIARAAQWWAERMLVTPRPFQERMTLFWHDHFATSQEKVHRHRMMLNQIELFRQHANGNFGELLVEVARDPAMLIWLDNKDNVKGQPNENFAREILELFSMGEGQGYTEQDIREAARAFTGWTLSEDFTTAADQGRFIEDSSLHDSGEKTILGKTGRWGGHDAIAIILEQEQTALYLTEKIYRYFVADETVDQETLDALAARFREADYELGPLMKTIFLSKDFYSDHATGSLIKSPVQLLVSTYRKLGLEAIPGIPDFDETTAALNQSLMMPPNVAGWPGGRTWINPATLLARGNFVHGLLFPPDPADFEPPDKDIHENIRHLPVKYADYDIVPHIWNGTTQSMEPVRLEIYDLYLAGLDFNRAMAMMQSEAGMSDQEMAQKMAERRPETKSALGKVSQGEEFNLAVGIYRGHVEANRRVKAIPRNVAPIDLTAMVRSAGAESSAEIVAYFEGRFLSVPLQDSRRTAIERFARRAVGEGLEADDRERALREVLYLVLSAPEYQLA